MNMASLNEFRPLAIAFDLDDTLLRNNLTISQYTVSVLQAFRREGVKIIPASGRALMSMKPFTDFLNCSDYIVACNGAEIYDGQTGRQIMQAAFSIETSRKIAEYASEKGCYAQTYGGEYFYYSEQSVWAQRYAAASMLKGVFVGNLSAFIQEPRNKLLLMADESKIAAMLPEAQKLFEGLASVTCSKPYFLEFNPPSATKGNALRFISESAQIPLSAFISFGDSLNDLSMLQITGWSVAMENGRNELKSICRSVCRSNEEDGVADFLVRHFPVPEVTV